MKNKRALRTKLKRQKYLTCVLGKRTVTTKSVWHAEKEKEKEKESRARVSLCVYLCARKRLVVAVVAIVNRRQNTRVFWFSYTNNNASEIKSKMSGGKKEEVKIEREEHVRDVFENFRTSKITRDDVARLRLNNSSSINSDKSSNSLKSVDDGTTRTIIDVLREIFLQRREEGDEEDFAKFYHFCFLACLKGKTEGTNATISVHEACELWSFLLSSTKKQQLRKSSSSLSIEEGGAPYSTWGGMASLAAKVKGIAGIVVDGGVRDFEEIKDLNFPVFSRHLTPTTGRTRLKVDQLNVPVNVGGVRVCPGDIIVGDGTGILSIPSSGLREITKIAERYVKDDAQAALEIRKGLSFSETMRKFSNI